MKKGDETRVRNAGLQKMLSPHVMKELSSAAAAGIPCHPKKLPNPSQEGMDETLKEKRDGKSPKHHRSFRGEEAISSDRSLPDEDMVDPLIVLICPKCKILYERGSSCIRCRSPLVEKGSSVEREEIKPPDTPGLKEVKPLLVQAPGFKEERKMQVPSRKFKVRC